FAVSVVQFRPWALYHPKNARLDEGSVQRLCPARQPPKLGVAHFRLSFFAPALERPPARVCRKRLGQPTRTSVSSGSESANSYIPQGLSSGPPLPGRKSCNATANASTCSR